MRRYQLLDILIEFKFLKLGELELTGNALRQKADAELRQMTKVKQELDQARTQLQDYRRKLLTRYGALLRLRTYAVVAIGFERLVWEEII